MKDIHDNSTRSFSEQKERGRTEYFRRAIYDLEAAAREPLTDRQLMAALNESDVNNVRPEVTRLKQDGLIVEVGKVQCEYTGKKVRTTRIASTVYLPRKTCRTRKARIPLGSS